MDDVLAVGSLEIPDVELGDVDEEMEENGLSESQNPTAGPSN